MFDDKLESLVEKLEAEASYCRNSDMIDELSDKYGNIQHPQIGYRLGELYLIHEEKESALDHLINSASFGLSPTSQYFLTGYANSIAQSMWYILRNYQYGDGFENISYKLFCNSYLFLSNCISSMGSDAYDSCRTRAFMIDDYKKEASRMMLKNYYYDGDDVCTEILSLSDYYLASTGYKKAGQLEDARDCHKWANEKLEIILSLPQYSAMSSMPIDVMVNISQQNHHHLIKQMAPDFKSRKFELTVDEISAAVEKYRIKPTFW